MLVPHLMWESAPLMGSQRTSSDLDSISVTKPLRADSPHQLHSTCAAAYSGRVRRQEWLSFS